MESRTAEVEAEKSDIERRCNNRIQEVEAEMRELIASAEAQREEYNTKVARLNRMVDVLQAETLGPLPKSTSPSRLTPSRIPVSIHPPGSTRDDEPYVQL